MKPATYLLVAFALMLAFNAGAAEWQWSVPEGSGWAFLWIPPDCARVRAVMVGQNNMLEEGILEHAVMRRTLGQLGIAEVFITPPFDPVFQFDRGVGERFEQLMQALAAESGYDELAAAPVIPLGHSACASFPWNFAAWNPARTLAILSIKGDAPQTDLTGSGRPNPPWGSRAIDGVPGLMVMSETEWWEARLAPATAFRLAHPAAPIALLADVGRSHFDASDALVEFLALFVRKTAAARLPASSQPGRPAALRAIDPTHGWLVDRWRGDEPLRATAAPFADYHGDRTEAFWCFDQEVAQATEAYYARMRGKKTQQVDFMQADQLAPISTSHAGVVLNFRPLADGPRFRLDAAFITPLPPKPPVAAKDKPPPPSTTIPTVADFSAHAPGPVRISRITGPVAANGDGTFSVAPNRAASLTDQRGSDIWLLAEHPGDAAFKSAVQQAVMHVTENLIGVAQHISFPPIGNQSSAARAVKLSASSDSGAPVAYYVREGPAEIEGDSLRFTIVPPRAKFPVKVTVVAWQLGHSGDAPLRAAAPVERQFFLTP